MDVNQSVSPLKSIWILDAYYSTTVNVVANQQQLEKYI